MAVEQLWELLGEYKRAGVREVYQVFNPPKVTILMIGMAIFHCIDNLHQI